MTVQELKDNWYFGAQPKVAGQERHHPIFDSAILNAKNYDENGLNRGSAPSLPMDYDDHRLLQSTGTGIKAEAIQNAQMDLLNRGDPMGAFELGIQEIRDAKDAEGNNAGLYEKYEQKINIIREEFKKWLNEPGKEYLLKPYDENPKPIKPDILRIDTVGSVGEPKATKHQNFSESKVSRSAGSGSGGVPIKQIGIVILIILILLLGFFLLRSCGGCSTGTPSSTVQTPIQSPPDPPPPQPVNEPLVFSEKTEMLFVANLSNLLPAASVWLDEIAAELSKYIEQNPDTVFQIIGYVAIVPGHPDANELSQERANKIVSELIARKINVNNLQAISGGETNRWGNNIDELSRAPNRRILIQKK